MVCDWAYPPLLARRYGTVKFAVDAIIDREGRVRHPLVEDVPEELRVVLQEALDGLRFERPDLPAGVHGIRLGLPYELVSDQERRLFNLNQVSTPAEADPKNSSYLLPRWFLRRYSGEITVRYVINKEGRIDPNDIWFERQLHPEVTDYLRAKLEGWRFTPATVDGEPVNQNTVSRFVLR